MDAPQKPYRSIAPLAAATIAAIVVDASLSLHLVPASLPPLARRAAGWVHVGLLLLWVHRAYVNLWALGSKQQRFTPGWAAAWQIIPLANFVRGYQAMRELWIESQPLPSELAAGVPARRRAPLVTAHLVSLLALFGALFFPHGAAREQAIRLLAAVSGALQVAVIVGITRRQREQWDDLVRRQPVPPPDDRLR